MKAVYKYPITTEAGIGTIPMPIGARILRVAIQHNRITLWALVDTEEKEVDVDVFVVATGQAIPAGAFYYVGTVDDGPFVWHIFTNRQNFA